MSKQSFMAERMKHLQGMGNWPNAQVPLSAQATEFSPELCKISYEKLFRDDPVAMAECTLLVQEYLDLDMVIGNMDAYNFEAESIGAKIKFYTNHCPDFDRSDFFIKDETDLDKIKFKGLDSGRFPYYLKFCEAWKKYTGFDYDGAFSAPWTLACNLHGPEEIIMDTIMEPEFVHEIQRRIVEDLHVPMIKALHKELPNMAVVNLVDAFASIPMVNADIAENFIEPYLNLERKLLEDEGIAVVDTAFFGSARLEGQARKRYEEFIVRANGMLLAVDPDASQLGMDYFRRRADELRTPMMAGIAAKTVEFESPETLVKIVKDYILKAKRGITPAVFVLNNITPGSSVENVLTVTHAGRVYGAPDADENTEFLMKDYPTFEEFLKNKMENNVEGYSFAWMKESGYAYLLK